MKKQIITVTLALIAVIGTLFGISKITGKISTIYNAKEETSPSAYTSINKLEKWNDFQIWENDNGTKATYGRLTNNDIYNKKKKNTIKISVRTLHKSKYAFCMQKGVDFEGWHNLVYRVRTHYTVATDGTVIARDYNDDKGKIIDRYVNGDKGNNYKDKQYHNAVVYIMTVASKNCTHRDGSNESHMECDHQKAMWAIRYHYYQSGTSDFKITDKTAYGALAREAVAYGRYAISLKNNPIKETTKYSADKLPTYKKEIKDYTVYGPYQISYPTASYNDKKVGGIKNVTVGNGLYICDKNGNKIDNMVNSGQPFYIAIKNGQTTGNIVFNINKSELSGEYYYLIDDLSRKDLNQTMAIGTGKYNTRTVPLTITVKNEQVQEGQYTISIDKIDSITQQQIQGSKFEIRDEEDNIIGTIAPEDEAATVKIKIGETEFTKKTLTYKIKEVLAPDGYKAMEGEIVLTLTIGKKDNKYVVTNTQMTTPTGTNVTKEEAQDKSSIQLSIPNIAYPKYEVVLNKKYIDENKVEQEITQELLRNTEFKIEAYIENEQVGGVIGNFNLGTNTKDYQKQLEIGEAKVNITDGKMDLLFTPKVNANILIKITEVKSPDGYTMLEYPIVIRLQVENKNGIYTITGVSSNTENDSANNGRVQYVELTTQKAEVNVFNNRTIKEDSTILRIAKYSSERDTSGNKIPLAGVKFGIYAKTTNTLIDTITTNEQGIASYNIEYKKGYDWFNDPDMPEFRVGQNLSHLQLEVKEISTLPGYEGLQDNEKIILDIYAGYNLDKTGIMTNMVIITNQINQTIEINTIDSNGIVTQAIESQKNIKIVNELLKDYNNADWHNGNTNYTVFSQDMDIKMSLQNQKIIEGTYPIKIIKTDGNTEQLLAGAEFGLYHNVNVGGYDLDNNTASTNTKPITTGTTNDMGELLLNIPLTEEGEYTYYLKEIKAANGGYILLNPDEYIKLTIKVEIKDNAYVVTKVSITNMLSQDKSITIKQTSEETVLKSAYNSGQGQSSKEFTSDLENIGIVIPNYKEILPGSYNLNILKVDANNDNKKLQGAKFELLNELNESLGQFTTDANGSIDISRVIEKEDYEGQSIVYYLKEIEAPSGYGKIEGKIRITLYISKNNTNYYVEAAEVLNQTNINIKVGTIEVAQGGNAQLEVTNNQISLVVRNQAQIDLALKKFIAGVTANGNYVATTGREPIYHTESLKTSTEATYTFDKSSPVEVAQGNIVRYVIRIYNEGSSDGYASLIKDYLPNGVKLAENSETNSKYGWATGEDTNGKYISTNYLKDQKIGKYEGGITLNYKDVEVDLEVTMTNMYLGTLKNVAEIAEMKDFEGNIISQDVDSSTNGTTIDRQGDTITDYFPKEDDIDYEWIKLKDGIPFAGKVWLDVPEENTKDTENGWIDSRENFDEIVKNGGATAEIYKVTNNEKILIATTPVNNDGTYYFESIPKSDDGVNYNQYMIMFKYNGINYTSTKYKAGTDYKINSKAQEEIAERNIFNQQFATINGTSPITYTTTSNDSAKKLVSKYNYSDNMKMTSKTETISLNINTNTDELLYFNLGLKQRSTFDMALYKDVDHAKVVVNGQEQIYQYDKYSSYNPTTGTFDEFTYEVRNSDYNLGIRDVDRTNEAGLGIYVTYKINLINQSSVLGYVPKIIDYYDSHYTYVEANVRNNNGELVDIGLQVTPHENSIIEGTDSTYYKMDLQINNKDSNTILDNNENLYIYITLQFKDPTSALQNLSNIEGLRTMNFAEIAEYQTFDSKVGNTTPGLIDIDSAPGNFNITNYKRGDYLEDDVDQAPAITYVDNTQVRTMTGNVFEDLDNKVSIKDVKVELIEVDSSRNPIMIDGKYRELTHKETYTDENGNYAFENYLPGNYILKFSYGDREKIVLTTGNGGSNPTSYNGQDFQSTDYNKDAYTNPFWYTNTTDKSDATDDGSRREAVKAYSKELTNYLSEVLNSWKFNPVDTDKLNELIMNTNMYANTANMTLSVEYGSPHVNNNQITDYHVTGIDFGLKRRPIAELEITKEVEKITVLSSSGETLISADMTQGVKGNAKNVIWVRNGLIKIELEDALINGANLQIDYKVTVKNVGNVATQAREIVDYIDNSLRFDETNNKNWEVVKTQDLQNKEDEKLSLVNNNINLTKSQTIVRAKIDNPLVTKMLEPNESTDTSLTLTKTVTTSNSTEDDLSYNNIIEIVKTYNEEGRKTENSTPGNLNPEDPEPTIQEPGSDKAEPVTISNPTGQTSIYYILGISTGVLLIVGIILIKKFVIRKKD